MSSPHPSDSDTVEPGPHRQSIHHHDERREERLRRRRQREKDRRASETAEQKEARLAKRRERDRARRALQSSLERPEERNTRLERVRQRMREVRATETPEEREARLLHMTQQMRQRVANETAEEREAHLLQMRLDKEQRMASETAQAREARLLQDRDIHRQQRAICVQTPLFQQPSVHSKMKNFHLHLAGLQVSKCFTCLEKFPGLKMRTTAGADFRECLRCSQDKRTPKLYSAANNMDPGPVPIQLQVNCLQHFRIYLTFMCGDIHVYITSDINNKI